MKRTRIRSISKRDDRTLEMKADRLWAKRVLAENYGRCCKCNRKPATDPHHIIARANKRMRHDRSNGIGLCRFHHDWAHAKPAKLERDLQRLCEQELSRRGIWFLHLSPKAREKIGTTDLLFAINGQAIAVELKIEGGKVTEDQTRNHAEMRANGWTVEVCWSFEQFRAVIDSTTKAANIS